MDRYRIFETDECLSCLSRLDSRQKVFIEAKLRQRVYPQLRERPHFGPNIKKLHGYQPETWRYRVGRYRVFYGIDESTRMVNIVTVDHRKDAYR